jgi:hypothetical protein
MQDWHPSHTNTTRFDPFDEYHIKVKHIALPPSKTSNKNETNGNSHGPNRFDTEARSTTPSTPPLRGLVDPRTAIGCTARTHFATCWAALEHIWKQIPLLAN